ncbi:MAG: hypothetical protein Tsb0020_10680 [Haliangiales bacterium]
MRDDRERITPTDKNSDHKKQAALGARVAQRVGHVRSPARKQPRADPARRPQTSQFSMTPHRA